jgi:uncharacterized protein (TIGR03067 family)
MSRMWICAIPVILVACSSSAQADPSTDEARRLAGKWVGTSGVWSGKALTAAQAGQCVLNLYPPRSDVDLSGGPRGMDLVVPDKLVGYDVVTSDGKIEKHYITEWKNYACGLDPKVTPHALAMHKTIGSKGHFFAAIYRTEADTMTLCINVKDFGTAPKEFKSPNGSEVLLLTFKRSK